MKAETSLDLLVVAGELFGRTLTIYAYTDPKYKIVSRYNMSFRPEGEESHQRSAPTVCEDAWHKGCSPRHL